VQDPEFKSSTTQKERNNCIVEVERGCHSQLWRLGGLLTKEPHVMKTSQVQDEPPRVEDAETIKLSQFRCHRVSNIMLTSLNFILKARGSH
jgi:hypothetical protein